MPTTKLVTPDNDEQLLAALDKQDRIAVDTEFMRESTYFAKLCLVQIATPTDVFCEDPLADGDLEAFWSAMMRCAWVLHSGRQDIEVIYQATERMPTTLFDTQVAAALIGFTPQIGYAALVRELFGKELPKTHTRADWTRRPLSEEMLHYAADDVEYLLDAYDILTERLDRLGRVEWAGEDSMALLNTSLYRVDADQAIDKLKGARNLRGRARRAAVGLASWRERRALSSDRPRRWVLKDPILLAIAQLNPGNERELAAIDGMPATTARRCSGDLLDILNDAANGSDNYVPPAAPSEQQKSLLRKMQLETATIAEELGIAAEIVAPRRELAAALNGERDCRVFSGWRREIVGDRLLELLD